MVTKNFIENKVFDKNPSLYGSLSDKKKIILILMKSKNFKNLRQL